MGFGAKSPSYTPPPAPPPAAAPATLASSSIAAKGANQSRELQAGLTDVGAAGAGGISPLNVNTAKNTLGTGGATTLGGIS